MQLLLAPSRAYRAASARGPTRSRAAAPPAALVAPPRHLRRGPPALAAAAAAAVLEAPAREAALEEESCGLDGPAGGLDGVAPAAVMRSDFHANFTMGETLGQGSYGTVRACVHNETGEQFAVKVVPKRKLGEDRTDAIMREVSTWALLSGRPHIARLAGAWQDASAVYLVQELMLGGDLQALLDASGPLPEPEAAAAMHGVLGALAECHAVSVCYGDVKPANFLLAGIYPSVQHLIDPSRPKGDMQLRAVDFGCAQLCPDGCGVITGLSGTPVYIAPEVISDRRCSVAMDVWAAGVMLYQMLTGQFPFWDTDMAGLGRIHPRRILEDIRTGAVLLDAPCCAALSPGARDLLRRMLEKDPEARAGAAEALAHPWVQQQLAAHRAGSAAR